MANEESEHIDFVKSYKKLFEFDMFSAVLHNNNYANMGVLDYFQTDYPVEFLDLYLNQQYFKHDPKWWVLKQKPVIYYWGDVHRFICNCPSAAKIFSDFRDANVVDGITYSFHRKSFNITLCFINKKQMDKKEIFKNMCIVRALGNHIAESVLTLFRSRLNKSLKITHKQIEVISLMLAGNSRTEVAHILDLSPKTIDAHLDEAKIKFSAQNRRELLLIANELMNCR
ncbi:MAG: autoinducer binding domain-containing protein [Deferribacterales bacterium]